MKISVIIPTYNRADLIGATLDSVLGQTRPPDEIIVADDGSTDDTAAVVASYGARVRHLRRPRVGHCAVRNAGWAASTGDALCFLDSDDVLLPGALAALESALEAAPEAALVYCRSQTIDTQGAVVEPLWPVPDHENDVWDNLIRGNFIRSPGCALVRRASLGRAGPWNEVLKNNVDWDMWIRLAEESPFVRVEMPLFQYRIHGGNLSGSVSKMYVGSARMFQTHLPRHRRDPVRRRRIADKIRQIKEEGARLCIGEAYRHRQTGRHTRRASPPGAGLSPPPGLLSGLRPVADDCGDPVAVAVEPAPVRHDVMTDLNNNGLSAGTSPADNPSVCVVILNWNGLTDTKACLDALRRSDYPNWSALVVDNGSQRDDVKAIRAQYPDVTVLETGRNLGYAGGNNVGLAGAAQAGADYLFVLNNDTEVAPGCLSALVEAGEAHPEAGAIGCFVFAQTPPRDFLYAGLHAHSAPRAAVMGERYDAEVLPLLDTRAPVRVDSAHGCGFAITRRAYEAVGGFDTNFFAVHEEVDWCMRAREAGFEILAAPAARIRHKVAASFGGRSPNRLYYDVRNLTLYYRSRTRVGGADGCRCAGGCRSSGASAVTSVTRRRRAGWPTPRRRLEAGWDGLRLRGGPRHPRRLAAVLASGLAASQRLLSRGRRLCARAYWAANARLLRVFRPEAVGK